MSNRPDRAAPMTSSKYGATISRERPPGDEPGDADALYGERGADVDAADHVVVRVPAQPAADLVLVARARR